jgi:hypothetical protein
MNYLDKQLRRKTHAPFQHYKKEIVVELVPGDVIRLRLLGQRVSSSVSIEISHLYFELIKRRVAARRLERQKLKQQRKRKK